MNSFNQIPNSGMSWQMGGLNSYTTLVTVSQSDCPCNWTTSATNLSIINPEGAGDVTEGHINMIVTKLC